MELERVYEGDILGKEEWSNGIWRFLCGPVINIDKEEDFVVLKIKEGREFMSMSFKSEDLWPVYAILLRKNRIIQSQKNVVKAFERFIVSLIKGNVSEGGAQEVLELFHKQDN